MARCRIRKQLKRIIKRLLYKSSRMLKEEITEEDIAQIVAKWTNIPVGRLMEGEPKRIHMEHELKQR